MGDKIKAKSMANQPGLPVVPGSDKNVNNLDEARFEANKIGYPILIKSISWRWRKRNESCRK